MDKKQIVEALAVLSQCNVKEIKFPRGEYLQEFIWKLDNFTLPSDDNIMQYFGINLTKDKGLSNTELREIAHKYYFPDWKD